MSPATRRRLLLSAAFILTVTDVGLLQRTKRVPTESERRLDEAMAEIDAKTAKLSDRPPSDDNHRHEEALDLAADRWFADLQKRYPWLAVEFRDVPDEQNGFLRYIEYLRTLDSDGPSPRLPIPGSIQAMMDDATSFDAEAYAAWMEMNRPLLADILAIAEAPDRSSKGIDPWDFVFIEARPAAQMAGLLRLEARLAMTRSDQERTRRLFAAAMNLASHFDGIETPTLLSSTVAILIRSSSQNDFLNNHLPTIADDPAALKVWREALRHQEPLIDSTRNLLVGEWHVTTRAMILPGMISGNPRWFGEGTEEIIREAQPWLDAHASILKNAFVGLTTESPSKFAEHPFRMAPEASQLCDASREQLEALGGGTATWLGGMHRAQTEMAMTDALFAIALGENPPVDPISGKPFVWDSGARTLSAPFANGDIEPLCLP